MIVTKPGILKLGNIGSKKTGIKENKKKTLKNMQF